MSQNDRILLLKLGGVVIHQMENKDFRMDNHLFDQILLTEQDAAALLQPHMRNKSALDWLAYDRRLNPAIPFLRRNHEIYYPAADVVAFITRLMNPSARFVRMGQRLITEQRGLPDRRYQLERRHMGTPELNDGIERRVWGDLDRRLWGELSRRSA